MSLHDEIMNIQANPEKVNGTNYDVAYKEGHRDARHAAAELAIAHDAICAELLEALQGVLKVERGSSGRIILEGWHEEVIRAVIAKATGAQP